MLMYVPIVYGFLPDINVFVFVFVMNIHARAMNHAMTVNFLKTVNLSDKSEVWRF